jgi:hypothetical protein
VGCHAEDRVLEPVSEGFAVGGPDDRRPAHLDHARLPDSGLGRIGVRRTGLGRISLGRIDLRRIGLSRIGLGRNGPGRISRGRRRCSSLCVERVRRGVVRVKGGVCRVRSHDRVSFRLRAWTVVRRFTIPEAVRRSVIRPAAHYTVVCFRGPAGAQPAVPVLRRVRRWARQGGRAPAVTPTCPDCHRENARRTSGRHTDMPNSGRCPSAYSCVA